MAKKKTETKDNQEVKYWQWQFRIMVIFFVIASILFAFTLNIAMQEPSTEPIQLSQETADEICVTLASLQYRTYVNATAKSVNGSLECDPIIPQRNIQINDPKVVE